MARKGRREHTAPSLPVLVSFPCIEPLFPSIPTPPIPTPQVAKRLFGVDVVPADGQAPVWHEDVRFFQLLKDGQPKAWFYLDPYSRCGGRTAATWCIEP